MAIQKGIIKLKGKLGDISFYKTQDGHLAREASGIDAKRLATDPAFARTRENMAEFSLTAKAGKVMRDALRPLMKNASDNRVTGRLMKVMNEIKKLDSTSVRGKRSVGVAIAQATAKALLKGFNFNERSLLSSVLAKPFSINTATGVITINGLVPINDMIVPQGATHFTLKSCWAKINFTNNSFDVQLSNVVSLAIDGISSNVVLTPAAVPAGTGTTLFLLQLEFFQQVNGVWYSLQNGYFNTMSVAEVV